jgi:hypothetical protein
MGWRSPRLRAFRSNPNWPQILTLRRRRGCPRPPGAGDRVRQAAGHEVHAGAQPARWPDNKAMGGQGAAVVWPLRGCARPQGSSDYRRAACRGSCSAPADREGADRPGGAQWRRILPALDRCRPRLTSARLVFVDAGVPPCEGEATTSAEFLEHLRSLAPDGTLPKWST